MSRLAVKELGLPGFGPVSFAISDGTCTCISGASGAGKSRLLRAIADLDEHSGEVWLDDVPQEQFAPSEWRRRVGLLPPDSLWWHDKVADHFAATDGARLAALSLDTSILEQPVARLSSGERQRLALLRLLANQPYVLLLDEPTANLDDSNAKRVERLIEHYRRETGAAVLWVSHDPAQAKRVSGRQLHMIASGVLEQSS